MIMTASRQLDQLGRGERGLMVALGGEGRASQRLLEMGFDVGVEVEVLHEGPFGRDPICVQVGGMMVALRRAEAALVAVAAEVGLELADQPA
jgi:ferrous iron transport protein A